jgi:hypothetical protein
MASYVDPHYLASEHSRPRCGRVLDAPDTSEHGWLASSRVLDVPLNRRTHPWLATWNLLLFPYSTPSSSPSPLLLSSSSSLSFSSSSVNLKRWIPVKLISAVYPQEPISETILYSYPDTMDPAELTLTINQLETTRIGRDFENFLSSTRLVYVGPDVDGLTTSANLFPRLSCTRPSFALLRALF